ncbi:MAG: hypothetical protein HOO98_00190 [Nitrospira sp.]|nr:hypothetical protein [Nitrospira sp.]
MSTRYHLDDLGWYRFEQLVQAALKAELGIGVESWGERRDHGRDAYCNQSLRFPSKHIVQDGPFIFQVKFVENANASGARSEEAIYRAAEVECSRIRERQDADEWEEPSHYTLLTNAPLSASLRDKLQKKFQESFPSTNFHSLGGNDVCDILDEHPNLRRAFPELLSLRDLDELLSGVVDRENLERSKSAIEAAHDVLPVFVPTEAYSKAWSILHKHHFAVLEGPPEMGKSSIAWMVALTQITNGWQAIVCDSPEDIFRHPASSTPRIFIADDAFGRTEYDPTRGSKWETQLDRVFRRLDSKHWLVWTSRKHILERACRQMDLQGKASSFPNPAAILVNAGNLTVREKSLMLYRHAKAAALETEAKALVKEHAKTLIRDPHFTPERIRRLVKERLPSLARDFTTGVLTQERVYSEILDAIRNPTERMRKSFRMLDPAYKWLLISLLETGHLPKLEEVRSAYELRCPTDIQKPFQELVSDLSEAFIKVQQSQW